MANKIFPSNERQGPDELLVNGPTIGKNRGPAVGVIPGNSIKTTAGRRLQRLGSRLLQPVIETYRLLPWTTRHTLKAGVNLFAVLYIFLTVPFRLAFYYDPYATTDIEGVNQWTEELTVFAVADGIADVFGLFQFVSFYRAWKHALGQLTSSIKSERKNNVHEPVRANSTNMLARTPSLRKRRGKTRWTIATINAFSSMKEGVVEKLLSRRKNAGDFFADSCLLFPEQYDQQAVAKTFCEVYVLAKTKFDDALAEYYREGVIKLSAMGILWLMELPRVTLLPCGFSWVAL
ncbi:uncharacterized protein KRP23_4103 [Phytophthora ramorum]|uniref:uncharacterized protein n=1 Tax=Phytophthora ramorum TaxID=164328 RepID=UPI00309AEBDD|nr:hypothetical protein KRP23_4103 [Phytophthora ramorum]